LNSASFISGGHVSCITFGFILFFTFHSFGQETDSIRNAATDEIEERIEILAIETGESTDYSDLVEDLRYLEENPVNLNFATASDLEKLFFLNEMQKFNLLAYRENYGQFATLYELSSIEGFDAETIAKILPCVCISDKRPEFRIKPGDLMKYGHNELILRYQRILEKMDGYTPTNDSALMESPGSRYLGSPDKYYLRYRFSYFDKIRFGFAAEKDAGEVFFKNNVSDTIQKLTGKNFRNGFDFYSFHLNVNDIGVLKSLSIGDYQLGFGQGLTLWSGLAFGKSSAATDIKRFGRGIRPSTSANESLYFRGAAATTRINMMELTAFYSGHKVDASLSESDSLGAENVYIESLQESGLHRTITEIRNKNSVSNRIIGANLSYCGNRLGIGITSFYSRLSQNLTTDEKPYNLFDFTGTENFNTGMDYSWLVNKVNIFGEVSLSRNGGIAQLHGLTASIHPSIVVSLLYRNYGRNYHNFYCNAFAQASGTSNEKGLYAGLTLRFRGNWSLSAYADSYSFPWLKYRIDCPSSGNEFMVRLQHSFANNASVYIYFRQKNNPVSTSSSEAAFAPLLHTQSNSFRFHIEYTMLSWLLLKNRVEYLFYRESALYKGNGFLAYQDIGWKNPSNKISLYFRYAIFDTDSWDERLYAYENDILYSFSVPAYYYKGARIFFLLQYRITPQLSFWLRLSRTSYTGLSSIGSGPDEIPSNHKTEIKAQVRLKF